MTADASKTTLRLMALTLPYDFDNTKSGKLILKGTLIIQALFCLDLPYILFYEPYKLITFIPVSVVILSLGIFVFKYIGGGSGNITAREVTVRPSTLFGIHSTGPEGTFPLSQFNGIRVDVLPTNKRGPHDRVYLVGNDSTPDIELARTLKDEGIALGNALGSLLHLPVEVRRSSY